MLSDPSSTIVRRIKQTLSFIVHSALELSSLSALCKDKNKTANTETFEFKQNPINKIATQYLAFINHDSWLLLEDAGTSSPPFVVESERSVPEGSLLLREA